MSELEATEARTRLRSKVLFLLLLPACIVGVALLTKGLYPVDLPSTKDPDFIDTVFDNRAVLWAARLLLISAAVVLAFGGFLHRGLDWQAHEEQRMAEASRSV